MSAFAVVANFEHAVARFADSKYAVATSTGTSALFLSMAYAYWSGLRGEVEMPARTFISVPMAALHAGFDVRLEDYEWHGTYEIKPLGIIDSALRFKRGMYEGGLQCLSFQARKLLNIGEGGMILTDDIEAWHWLKMARYSGRSGPQFKVEDVFFAGWQCYMTPEKAARGLHLMEYAGDGWADQEHQYPDLRNAPLFQQKETTLVAASARKGNGAAAAAM